MIKLGLTGGIGSGKTMIAHFFQTLNVPVYFSDIQAKKIMLSKAVKKDVINLIGSGAYYSSGEINKAYVSNKIFGEENLLESFNNLIHPIVKQDFELFCDRNSNQKYIIKESAILIETGLFNTLDKLLLITANKGDRIKRVCLRDNLSTSEISKKITKQLSDSEKIPFANFVIENNNETFLIPQLLEIHNILNK